MEQNFRPFHLMHMTNDVPALDVWYDDVFNPRRGFHEDNQFSRGQMRDASLIDIADVCMEPVAPAFREPGWEAYALGRFYNRFGAHWHSIVFYADDVAALAKQLEGAGIRYFDIDGKPGSPEVLNIFTHPQDTLTQLQFLQGGTVHGTYYHGDPRFLQGWDSSWWAKHHPLGVIRMAYTTVLSRDPAEAQEIYARALGAQVLNKDVNSDLTATTNAYVAVGDTIIEFACPTDKDSLAGKDFEKNGQIHHAVAFRVQDLPVAVSYLESKGIAISARDENTVLTDPATTQGVPFRFTTWDVPGDPRGVAKV